MESDLNTVNKRTKHSKIISVEAPIDSKRSTRSRGINTPKHLVSPICGNESNEKCANLEMEITNETAISSRKRKQSKTCELSSRPKRLRNANKTERVEDETSKLALENIREIEDTTVEMKLTRATRSRKPKTASSHETLVKNMDVTSTRRSKRINP